MSPLNANKPQDDPKKTKNISLNMLVDTWFN